MNIFNKIYLFIKIYLSLIVLDYNLKKNGFHKVFIKYESLYVLNNEQLGSINPNTYSSVNQMVDFIDKICTLYPRKAECLHRSFLGYKYLRKELKLPVDIVIGVKKFPFSAHAWLTMFEKNINDPSELTNQYSVILKSKGKNYEMV